MHAPNKVYNTNLSVKSAESRSWLITIALVFIFAIGTVLLWGHLKKFKGNEPVQSVVEPVSATTVALDSNAMESSNIQVVSVIDSAPAVEINVPGVAEPNQEQLQQVTPLVAGRVDHITVGLGDYVKAGSVLLTIDSPQVAELHGKLHEADTRLKLAQQAMERVTQSANKVAILKSKATLEESEATLKRTSQLVQEGLSARKDLVAAEAGFERAKADFNFQNNISLNREVAEARAELNTAQTETDHIKDALSALDAQVPDESRALKHNISKIEMKAPINGTVIERFVNPGAGFEAGKPLLTLANTSRLWVIASVPEGKINSIFVGMPATVRLGKRTIAGKVNYIDPRLNEDTRTARVRVEIDNSDEKIKCGCFVEVVFKPEGSITGTYVPSDAVQSIDGKSVVFVEEAPSKFVIRDVQLGGQTGDLVAVTTGLRKSERVVANGSFVIKSRLMREQLGEED